MRFALDLLNIKNDERRSTAEIAAHTPAYDPGKPFFGQKP